MDCLYSNLDGLEVAMHGTVDDTILAQLASARAEAEETRRDAQATLGGVKVMVKGHGASGGFAYVFSTGEDGETWFCRKANGKGKGTWMLRASLNSALFLTLGRDMSLEALRKHIDARLQAFGYTALRDEQSGLFESMGRVDFAMDFRADDFELDPGNVATKAGKTGYWEGATAHWSGRRVTGCTVGKMPNRQVVIYDKTKDARAKQKDYWFPVWGLDPEDKAARVWRVELRAGKRFLREAWQVKGWDDLAEALPSIIADTLVKVRLVERTDSNVTRCPDAPLWIACHDTALNVTGDAEVYAPPGLVKETVRERFSRTMRDLLRGVAITKAAVEGCVNLPALVAYLRREVEDITADLLHDADDTADRIKKARGRYHLLESDEWTRKWTARQPAFGPTCASAPPI